MGSGMMPKKIPENKHGQNETELQSTIDKLNKMLANVLTYISDEEVEVIDFEYLLDHTDGLSVFCNRKVQRNAIKNAEVCHPFNSFSTMRGTVYSSRHEKR
jgi:uncharacterized protein (DUF4213/DUF364 family)